MESWDIHIVVLKMYRFSGAENIAIMICKNIQREYECAYTSPEGAIRHQVEAAGIRFFPMKAFTLPQVQNSIQAFHPDIVVPAQGVQG